MPLPILERLTGTGEQPSDTGVQGPLQITHMVYDDHERINNLENWRDNVATPAMSDMTGEINKHTDAISSQQSILDDFYKWGKQTVTPAIESLNNTTGANKQSIDTLGAGVDSMKKVESDLTARVTAIESVISSLSADVAEIKGVLAGSCHVPPAPPAPPPAPGPGSVAGVS